MPYEMFTCLQCFRPFAASNDICCSTICYKAAQSCRSLYGLCPICGEEITLTGRTTNGRLTGSCQDAFTLAQWLEED